jgi:hypothetical protein|nr:MAG TPA_asm: hypothetical protein [Caudoviricetes sp.]
MTEKDLDEFEKEFGFKLLPTGFKKPLSEITKEEYRERIEYLYNAIMNDDSNEEDFQMIEERIDELIKVYQGLIYTNCRIVENHKETLIIELDEGLYDHIQPRANKIKELRKENEYFRTFIELLNYVKTGERK